MAIAHKLLVAAYHMLRTGNDFNDLGADYLDRTDERRTTRKLVQRLENLGYDPGARWPNVSSHAAACSSTR